MVQGRHAVISDIACADDHLYIPCMLNGQLTLNKFTRLAISTDGEVALYALETVREWERGIV